MEFGSFPVTVGWSARDKNRGSAPPGPQPEPDKRAAEFLFSPPTLIQLHGGLTDELTQHLLQAFNSLDCEFKQICRIRPVRPSI